MANPMLIESPVVFSLSVAKAFDCARAVSAPVGQLILFSLIQNEVWRDGRRCLV
jgi:hypothetical protein